jgi:hypothetical protein
LSRWASIRPGDDHDDDEQVDDDRQEDDLEPGQRPIERRNVRAIILEIEVHQ